MFNGTYQNRDGFHEALAPNGTVLSPSVDERSTLRNEGSVLLMSDIPDTSVEQIK